MAKLLDCKAVAAKIKEDCKAEADSLREMGITPKLGIVRVGEKGPDLSYEKGATRTMNESGIDVEVFALPADISQDDYITEFKKINANPNIHGILAFRPLDNINETEAISENISSIKDCDSTTMENMGKVVVNDPTGLRPCTPEAILAIVDYYQDEIKEHFKDKHIPLKKKKPGFENDVFCGLNVCVINKSNVIGKPLSIMLLNRYATVTMVHHMTPEDVKKDYLSKADIIIGAAPERDFIIGDYVSEDAVVIDATVICEKAFDEDGNPIINEKTGRQKVITYGCCRDDVEEKVAYKTPVPGVGAVTSAMLAKNLLKACKIQNNIK